MASSEQRDEGADDSNQNVQANDSKADRDIITVDRESTDDSVFKSIGDGINAAKENSIIRIASGTYAESVVISTPGLTLEPIDEDGKVILISTKKP